MDALALVAFAIWCFVVALAGGTLGLVLGNIRLPAMLLVASSPAAGAGANIGVSGVSAFTAAVIHIRAGRIDWRLFAWMAPPSMAGAVVGGLISGAIPDTALLLVIGVTLFYFGVDLLRRGSRPRPDGRASGGLDTRAAVVSGALIGLLGGLVGLILGTLRMPALLRWVGAAPAKAVGTNLAVGFWVGVAGVVGHVPGGVDWTALAVGAGASIPGALLGARITGRLSEPQLRAGSARSWSSRARRRLCKRLSNPLHKPIFTPMALDEHLLRALLEHTGDRVFAKDLDGRITFASVSLARSLGFADPSELIGRNDIELPSTGEGVMRVSLRDPHGEIVGTAGIGPGAARPPRSRPWTPTSSPSCSCCARTRSS